MRTAIKTGGIIVSALITVTSGGLAIAQVGTLVGYNVNWQWIALGGFLAFAGFMGWVVFDLRQRISGLEQMKPSIEAYPQCGMLEGAIIRVKNNGAEGNFQAQIEVIDTTEPKIELDMSWLYYKAYWDGEMDETVTIMKGMTRFIKLATFVQGTASGWLRIYRMTPTVMQYLDTHSYPIFTPEKFVIPEVCLSITISSTPSAKEGPIEFILRINARGTMEVISTKTRRR